VKAFRGSADTAFIGSVSGSDNDGGTITVDLTRSGSVDIDLSSRIPKTGSSATEFLGETAGGTLRVNDGYSDTIPPAAGAQIADGTSVQSSLSDLAFLTLNPSSCTYQLRFSFVVPTTSTGDWPMPPDPGAGGVAVSPARHIPPDLKLDGSAVVPAYYEGCAGSAPAGGCYEFEGFGANSWEQEFDILKTCGSVAASSCVPSGEEGTAAVSWSMSPQRAVKTKHNKAKRRRKGSHTKNHKKRA
jgi:hypothetical protein